MHKTCPTCGGSGKDESDTTPLSIGIAIGVPIPIGSKRNCSTCHGSGSVDA